MTPGGPNIQHPEHLVAAAQETSTDEPFRLQFESRRTLVQHVACIASV